MRHVSRYPQGIPAAFRPAGPHLHFGGRLAAGQLIGGDGPARAKPSLGRAGLLEIGDPARLRARRRRCALRPSLVLGLFGDGCLPGSPIDGVPGFPNGYDIARLANIHGGVAIDEQQVRSLAGGDLAAIVEVKDGGGSGRGGVQGFGGGEAGAHQQLQFPVDAGALRSARVAGVGAGEDRNMCCLQLPHGFIGALATGRLGQAEASLHGGGLGGQQVGLDTRIVRQFRIEAGAANAIQHGERGNDEDVMRGGDPAEVRGGCRPDEQMRQAVSARIDGIQRLLQGADVRHHQLSALVRRFGQRLHQRFAERRAWLGDTIFEGVVVDDLDVIRALGDARVDPCLRFFRPGERGDRDAVLGAVASRDGRQVARRPEIGIIAQFPFALLLLDAGGHFRVGEHIEVGGHAENGRLLEQGFGDGVGMGVDQAGEQRLSRAIHDVGAGRARDGFSHGANDAVLHQHTAVFQRAGSVEHADVLDQQSRGCGLRDGERRGNHAGDQGGECPVHIADYLWVQGPIDPECPVVQTVSSRP